MEQFVAVASAHFLALLIPGADFVLIARTALASGRRLAVAVACGVAFANAVIIAIAFSGLALLANDTLLAIIQVLGGGFLLVVGVAFLRSGAAVDLESGVAAARGGAPRHFALGVASGLLNPKNVLFYVSLGALLPAASALVLTGYGAWMFTVVLVWDIIVAVALGSPRALARFSRILPLLSRLSGAVLVVIGGFMAIEAIIRLVSGR